MLTPERRFGALAVLVCSIGLVLMALPEQAQRVAVPVFTFATLFGAAGGQVGYALVVRRRAVLERERIEGPPRTWREWWDRLE